MQPLPSSAQYIKAVQFKNLHKREGVFIIPNAWDAGSAKILESLGFEAVATTSAGLAFSLAKADARKAVSREECLANAHSISQATHLPVSADLENGYGDDPETCAETILLAAKNDLVGCTLEDATGISDQPIYSFELAVERVKAAADAARSLPFPFMLTARCENYLYGRPDLKDTVRRLVSFAEAGADLLYAPGINTKNEIETIVKAVAPKPVNFLLVDTVEKLSMQDLGEIGVKRISLGSSLARIAYGAFMHAVQDIQRDGKSKLSQLAVSYNDLNQLFK
ncbi:MAG: isocitrate lyase/phosphoenolpyruvate mutase family protein [Bacteroidetes bacterium]|nr:isocitrate lyase/phosphoenolpyruvate mutase family protein [Bacteroidota bacterium]